MEDKDKKLQEMQIVEQNLQNIIIQKQAFQMELNEIDSASRELEKSKGEVYKIVGQLMISKEKGEIKNELKEKEKIISSRINALDKQEEIFSEKAEKLRKEFLKNAKTNA
jgi:prefoldin beta subunit